MKNLNVAYLYFLSGIVFLIVAIAFYSTESRNLTPAFTSIGSAMMCIGFVLLRKYKRCDVTDNTE